MNEEQTEKHEDQDGELAVEHFKNSQNATTIRSAAPRYWQLTTSFPSGLIAARGKLGVTIAIGREGRGS